MRRILITTSLLAATAIPTDLTDHTSERELKPRNNVNEKRARKHTDRQHQKELQHQRKREKTTNAQIRNDRYGNDNSHQQQGDEDVADSEADNSGGEKTTTEGRPLVIMGGMKPNSTKKKYNQRPIKAGNRPGFRPGYNPKPNKPNKPDWWRPGMSWGDEQGPPPPWYNRPSGEHHKNNKPEKWKAKPPKWTDYPTESPTFFPTMSPSLSPTMVRVYNCCDVMFIDINICTCKLLCVV